MSNVKGTQGMLYRTLGSTGEKVSAIGIGGWHIGLNEVDEQLSIRIIRTAVDRGINFMDNCWDYNGGGQRDPHGQSAARWLQGLGISDDKDRWPIKERSGEATRPIAPSPPGRHDRSRPAPRSAPVRRPSPNL